MDTKIWKSAWDLLSPRERRMAWLVVFMAILGGGAQIVMIGALMPFLTFISSADPSQNGRMVTLLRDITGIHDAYEMAVLLGGVAVAAILAANAILLARSYMIARFTMMRVHAISSRLFGSYLDRPYDYFLGRNSGDIGKRILSETGEISSSFLQPAADLVASGISIIFILVFLLTIEPVGTIVGISLISGIYGTIQAFSSRYLRRLGENRVAANRGRFLAVNEIFGAIKDVKTHGTEDVYRRRFERASQDMLKAAWKSKIAAEAPKYLIQAIFFSSIVVACFAFIDPETFRMTGSSVSEMIPVLGILALAGQRIVPELQKVYAALSKINFGGAAILNVHEDMRQPDHPRALRAGHLKMERQISLQGVGYRYPGSQAGLSEITLQIRKGERVGVVGGTGAGKTTLVDILLGLLQCDTGTVRVDDTDLSDRESRLAWKTRVSYVPQSVFLADATIAENIAFGVRPAEIDHDKVVESARIAQIHDLVAETLPEGYETRVGERGAMLSGGQVQRLGIARALYRDADLIVLDEATSALDRKIEADVMDAIDRMPNDVTIVMIAHRLETLRGCGRILVLEAGQLAEHGSWDELAKAGGLFSRMSDGSDTSS